MIWSLGLILMLCFAGGLALDLWRVLSQRGPLIAVADKAALAAANELAEHALYYDRLELDRSEAEKRAKEFAREQLKLLGWDDHSMAVEVELKDRNKVEVKVSGKVQLTLLQLFAPPQGIAVSVTSRAFPCVHRTDRGASIRVEDCR